MAHSIKHHLSALIRSGKPNIQPSVKFVTQLHDQLHQRATQLTPMHLSSQPTFKKPLLWFSTFGVGAMAIVLASVFVLPTWFKSSAPISGYIQKGPFISGSNIIIQELNNDLQPIGTNYQVTTQSDFGDYILTQDTKAAYVEVIAQGFYFDEVRGELSEAPLTLRSIAHITNNRVVNVNILTTLAVPRIRYLVANGMSFFDAKRQAQQEVLTIFSITEPASQAFESLTISESGKSNAILLAASVLLQGYQRVGELSELLSKLSLGIETDGVIASDSPLLNQIRINANQLSTHDISEHLRQRFTDLGVSGTVPDFSHWLEPFVTNADPFSYQLSLLDNQFGVDHTPGASINVTLYGSGFVQDKETVALKGLYNASATKYIDDHTIVATFPIDTLSAGSYTITMTNTDTGRTGVTDGEPLEDSPTDVQHARLVLRGYAPEITNVTSSVSYVQGGTITITGKNFTFGTFVWINGWQVPQDAIRIASEQLLYVDLSPALIANNTALPRKTKLTITVQTPDFQTAKYSGWRIP